MATFGDRLKTAMIDAHLTAAELAKASGVGEDMISRYLNGSRQPRQSTAERLARALSAHVGTLYGIERGCPAAPAREQVCIMAATKGADQGALSALRAAAVPKGRENDRQFWWDELRALTKEIEAHALTPAAPKSEMRRR